MFLKTRQLRRYTSVPKSHAASYYITQKNHTKAFKYMIYYNIYDMIWHKLKETKFDNLLKIYQQYFTWLQMNRIVIKTQISKWKCNIWYICKGINWYWIYLAKNYSTVWVYAWVFNVSHADTNCNMHWVSILYITWLLTSILLIITC